MNDDEDEIRFPSNNLNHRIIDFKREGFSGDWWSKKIRRLPWLIFAGVLVAMAASVYYQVEPDEVGVVTRFGQYVRTAEPGPHFRIPFGIERVSKLPVQRQLKQEFGFKTLEADTRSEYTRDKNTEAEALMLTGDLNVASVEWIVQYKISGPTDYLFEVQDPESTFRDLAEASMRSVVGDRSVTEVLTVGREEIQLEAKNQLQLLCDRYKMGIDVLQLVLQDVNPPESVKPSFNEVNQAIQERERKINEAMAQYNRVIPQARGRAEQEIQTAEGYATERVNRAKGESARFIEIHEAYVKSPKVMRTRLYLEMMSEVLPKSGNRIFVDSELKGLVPLLSLDQRLGSGPKQNAQSQQPRRKKK